MSKSQIISTITSKLEHYCAYQERCHQEVSNKLYELGATPAETDAVIVHLIEHNFLNEERFAQAFARGKHRIKKWGRVRIVNELKSRHISSFNIKTALKEISPDEYSETFERLAEHHWQTLPERDTVRKRKKFCDFSLRKGYESDLVYAKMKEMINDAG